MPAESPPQLDALLIDVLARSPDERAAFMREACGGDAKLRGELEELLRLHEQAGDFLESPAVALPERRDLSDIGERLGSVIGRYKLLEHIGEGGFGSVFMAEQAQPVRRKVALKVIKLGMDTRQVVARFEAERQALAMMDHPNIARVLDGGATESGRPYFVMELVRGTPITAFCDEHRMTVRERLDLFVQVCQAVQHAHTKGVIHRDLKPSNILAVRNDGTPTVKVIDFGIVKAIGVGERLTDKTLFTEFRQLIGTPAYMSPEQAGMSDIDIDTRSDIYSLGVLLYELLSGTTPFDAKSLLESGHDEMRRIIREVEPPRPSTRLSSLLTASGTGTPRSRSNQSHLSDSSRSLADSTSHPVDLPPDPNSSAAATVAAFRRTDPRELARSLRGELDWIAMKCLDKDRSRRYETAGGLARDIERHLKGEAVVAAPPSRLYRLSKTLRRHSTAAVVATSFVVLIAAALVGMGVLWRQAKYESQHAADARDAESDQRARSAAVSAFLAEMLTTADPAKSKGEKLTMREALDQAAKRIDEGALRDQPLVEAEIRNTIGTTYFSLSPVLWPLAGAQFRAAEALQSRELGDDHLETLRSRFHLARTMIKTDLTGAAALAKPTLETQRRVLGSDHIDTLRTMVLLGVIHAWSGRFHEGESLLVDAIQRREKSLGSDHVDTAYFLNRLGEIYIDNTHPERAEPLHREAFRIYAQAFGDEHPDTMRSLEDLGASLHNQHRDEEAEAIYRRLLEPTSRIFGPDSPATLGLKNELAGSLMHQGKHAEAEPIFRATLAAQLRTLGPTDYDTIMTQRWFASSLAAQKRYADSEALLRDALAAALEKYGPQDVGTSMRLKCALASVLAQQKKDPEAEQIAREVIDFQRTLRPRPWLEEVQQVSFALIQVLDRRGANDEAVKVERELIDTWLSAARAPNANAHTLYMAAWRMLTPENEALRDPQGALQLALQLHKRSGGKDSRYLRTLARAHSLTGDAALAVEFQKRSLELMSIDSSQRSDEEARLAEYEETLKKSGE